MQNISSPLAEPKYGKPVKILVWCNGDFESPGKEVKLYSLRSWNVVLNYLTIALNPRFGAVRKLYHLETRRMVTCLSNLENNQRYVAVGSEKIRFRKNGYLTGAERLEVGKNKSSKKLTVVEECMLNFMDCTKRKKRTVIYVMVSGRPCQEPIKVVLTEADLASWNMVLEFLAYQLDVAEGVQYLCKTTGNRIFRPDKVRHGDLYIAVPFKTKFVKMEYTKIFSAIKPTTPMALRTPRRRRSRKKLKSGKKQSCPSMAVQVEMPPNHLKCLNPRCYLRKFPRFTCPACNSPAHNVSEAEEEDEDARDVTKEDEAACHVTEKSSPDIIPENKDANHVADVEKPEEYIKYLLENYLDNMMGAIPQDLKNSEKSLTLKTGQPSPTANQQFVPHLEKETQILKETIKRSSTVDQALVLEEDIRISKETTTRSTADEVSFPDLKEEGGISEESTKCSPTDQVLVPDLEEEKSISKETIECPTVDEVLVPDLEEQSSISKGTTKSSCEDYLHNLRKNSDSKVFTTFAELAKNKGKQPEPSVSKVSIKSNTSREEKLVSFSHIVNGSPPQETIYEEDTHKYTQAKVDPVAKLSQIPKHSILKTPSIEISFKDLQTETVTAGSRSFYKTSTTNIKVSSSRSGEDSNKNHPGKSVVENKNEEEYWDIYSYNHQSNNEKNSDTPSSGIKINYISKKNARKDNIRGKCVCECNRAEEDSTSTISSPKTVSNNNSNYLEEDRQSSARDSQLT